MAWAPSTTPFTFELHDLYREAPAQLAIVYHRLGGIQQQAGRYAAENKSELKAIELNDSLARSPNNIRA